MNPKHKKWRTLLRVTSINPDRKENCFYVTIPAFDGGIAEKRIGFESIPLVLVNFIHEDARFHCMINTGADSLDDIEISNWETR